MATFTSNSYKGRYLQLTITESVNVVENTSTLTWVLQSLGGSSNYYTTGPTTVTIDGTQVYYKARTAWNTNEFPAAKGSTSGTITVAHDSYGSKSISVGFSTAIYTSAVTEHGGYMTLSNIDRAAPSVGVIVSNITANSFKITVTSSATAYKWWYSLDGGSSWVYFDSSSGTSKETTVTGLSPNTSYTVQACARKSYNGVDGYSAKPTVKTLGGSVLHNASQVTADATTVSIVISATSYDGSFYHKLVLNNGSKDIISLNIGNLTAGKANRTVSLTAAQRITLLQNITEKTLNGTLYLKTYSSSDYSTQVGNTSSCSCIFATTAANSAPTFTGFTYSDTRSSVASVVGDASKLLQTYSYLEVVCTAGVAKNEASIASYSASIGGVAKTSTSTTLDIGTLSKSGNLEMTVTCTDSRGWSTTVTQTITVLAYSPPKLTAYRLRRKDEVGKLIQLSFNGSISAIKADGETNTNSLTFVGYYYKKTDDSTWSNWNSLIDSTTKSGTTFSFSTEELMELDENQSYDFRILIQDQLGSYSSYSLYLVLTQGTPIIAIRKRNSTYDFPRVGINNPNPKEAVDVVGNVKMNGALVLGYVGEATDNLNNYKRGGYYHYSGSGASNAPAGAGILEVVVGTDEYLIQRFTAFADGCALYVRSYDNGSWTAWSNK